MKVTKPHSVLAPEFVSAMLPHQPGHIGEMPQTVPALSSGTRHKLPAVPSPVTVLPTVNTSPVTTFPTMLLITHSTPITTASAVLPPV